MKNPRMPAFYTIGAFSEAMAMLVSDNLGLGVQAVYVPLDLMKIGRVRAVIGVLAERLSGLGFDDTMGRYLAANLGTPDTELAEYAEFTPTALADWAAELQLDPVAGMARVFGECVAARAAEKDDLEAMMRISTVRQTELETDPDESGPDEAADEAVDGPLADVFATPVEEDTTLSLEDLLGDYAIAWVRKHLSPVIARGLAAYRAQGTNAVAQELKVTKAPAKTLAALCLLAQSRWKRVAILYDRVDQWSIFPEDLHAKFLATFAQLRYALKDTAVLCFMTAPGASPDIEEQFSNARIADWSLAEIDSVNDVAAPFDAEVVRKWIKAASVGEPTLSVDSGPLKEIAEEAATLAEFVDRAVVAVESAARRGVPALDDVALADARALGGSGS